MKKKTQPKVVLHKTNNYPFIPAITTIAFPMLIGRGKKTECPEETAIVRPAPNSKWLTVAKYELSESNVKFFDAKGFPKKRWVVIKEIPVYEITSVESFGNEIAIGWKGAVYVFVFKKKNESFIGLRDQIRGLLEGQQQTMETAQKSGLSKMELSSVINSSINVVDFSFNILMGLHDKRINWIRLEEYASSLGNTLEFKGQIIAPLKMDFGSVSDAIKKQAPKAVSKEAFEILELIYRYFEGLKTDDDLREASLALKNAKAAIFAYYMLNDLMFGKVIGDVDSEREFLALEEVFLDLANESNIKVSFEQIKAGLERFVVGGEKDGLIDDMRGIFRDQLKLL